MGDYSPTIWLPRSDPASFAIGSSHLNKMEAGIREAQGRIAAPCVKVHTDAVTIANPYVTANLEPGDRVLLTAQANPALNGVHTYDPDSELLTRDPAEIYVPGRPFPVVAKTKLSLDEDYSTPEIWLCTDVGIGGDGFKFEKASGGGSGGASVPALRARVFLGTGPGPTTVAAPAIVWQTKDEDVGGFWNPAQPTRLTVPESGVYIVRASGTELARAAGARGMALRRDGVGWMDSWEDHALATEGKAQNVVWVGWLNAGQYFEVVSTYPPASYGQYAGFDIAKIGSGVLGSNPAKRVKGRVNADGTIASGTGFSVTKNAAGDYTINFTTPFAAAPTVQATPSGASTHAKLWNGVPPTVNSFRVSTFAYTVSAGVLNVVQTDGSFEFTAEDPGLGLEATMDVEPWHLVGAAGEPGFVNGWVTFDLANNRRPKFRKTPWGQVNLQGITASGTANGIFTLPVGYRPAQPLGFAVWTTDGARRLMVTTAGSVEIEGFAFGGGKFVEVNGVSFHTD